MKRSLRSANFWRWTAVALILVVLSAASAPWPAFGGSTGPSIAVIQFTNDAGASPSTVSSLSQGLYQAVAGSAHFVAAGSGPLTISPGINGDPMTAALSAGAKAKAQEIILGDIIKADSGSIVYRLTAYRIDPVGFIRSQVFTQTNAGGAAQVAAFATNVETLHAPRTAVGTIFSVTNGVFADLGESSGFSVGEHFNVMRNGSKVADARITRIDLTQATLAVTNSAPGYSPAVGDRLIGLQTQPAIAPATRANPSTFSVLGFAAAVGLTLLAIGHHGQPGQPLPQPSPSSSGIGGFQINSATVQSGAPPAPVVFQFVFSQPVDTTTINFTNTNAVFYTTTNPVTPMSPVTNLGGPLPSFDPSNTTLTINANTLTPGENVSFTFTSVILDTLGVSLTPLNSSFQFSVARHPLTTAATPVANGGVLGPQPQQPHQPGPGPHDPHGPRGPK